MFDFLRRRAKPVLHASLRTVEWDGRTLLLAFDADAPDTVALDVDGVFFSATPLDGARRVRFTFAFSPSGRGVFSVLPRHGRDGIALAAQPLVLAFGQRGLAVRTRADVPALAALDRPARCVPFGSDVATHEVAIVVPVFNAAALVERCLAALLAHTRWRARLIVIDDASTDPAIAALLARYNGLARVSVLRNEVNRGFTATANRGLALAEGVDVVLLNADTEVGPNWLTGLRRAAYAADDIASATAVSDNAGAFSVPELERANDLPACWTFVDAARALWQQAGIAYPELPTGNGFCLYLRRHVIDSVGVLDEAAFAQGYGEENDWCQRASQRGLRHVIAGNVLVRHARSASFGDERRAALGRVGMALLRERWPDYEREVGAALFSFERRVLDWRVRRIFADAHAGNAPRPRVLWVGAHAPEWTDAEVWNLRANGAQNELVFADAVIAADRWIADDPEPSCRALWDWLQVHAIEFLVVAERKESAAEILCRLLDIPVVVAPPGIACAQDVLAEAESTLRSFPERSA